jgi:ABC-type sugar transport system ATPase subunit
MTKHEKQPTISELNAEALDALIIRAQEAIDHNLSLSNDDIKLLLNAVLTLATMQERLSNKEVTVHKLRKLLGMVQSSEKLNHLLAEDSASKESTKIKRSRKPKVKKVQEPTKRLSEQKSQVLCSCITRSRNRSITSIYFDAPKINESRHHCDALLQALDDRKNIQ